MTVDFTNGDPNLESLVESILAVAPGVSQRLVGLLGSRESPEVTEAALRLLANLFCAHTDRLRRLFDCGLLVQLPPLLNGVVSETHLSAVNLCCNAAAIKTHALVLVDSAAIVKRMMALLSISHGEMLRLTVGFFTNATSHRDRHMTRRLVDDYRALPPVVATLRRAIHGGNQVVIHWCLGSVADLLVVGEAEAADDDRGVNPYIEPIDWLGAFELVDPLQNHPDPQMAEVARRVFSYFIPNDCD